MLSVDEKAFIQALGRKHCPEPMRPGKPERQDHKYVGYGAKSLIVGLLAHKGKVIGGCYDSHRHQGFLDFLNTIGVNFSNKELYLIVNNLSTRNHKKVK